MKNKNDKLIIVFCGPESTSKSTVSKKVAELFGAKWVPEHARSYVEQLNRTYTYDDVITIAKLQIEEYKRLLKSDSKIIIFDTFLIITKVWLEIVFNKVPEWLLKEIEEVQIDHYFLCKPDIPWVFDGVRENENRRHELYTIYKKEIEYYNYPYHIISGDGEYRIQKTINHINQLLPKQIHYDH